MRGGLTIAERRIEQTDSSTLSLFHADYFAGPHQALVNILPFPQVRLNRGLGVRSVTFETQLPMPSEILCGHISVKKFDAIADNRVLHVFSYTLFKVSGSKFKVWSGDVEH